MNYYPFHIGDYAVHTRHLTLLEDLAYRRLLDLYYTRETALPGEPAQVARLLGMREQVGEVEAVLQEFFVKNPEGCWAHVRCDIEIAKASAAGDRARTNGARGGRPRKTQGDGDGNPEKTQPVNSGNPDESGSKAPNTQDPLPNTQTPSSEGVTPTQAGLACRAMRQAGLPDANPSNPTLTTLLTAGMTVEELASAAAEAVSRGKANFNYALAVAEGRRRDAAKSASLPAAVAPAETAYQRQMRERVAEACPALARHAPGAGPAAANVIDITPKAAPSDMAAKVAALLNR